MLHAFFTKNNMKHIKNQLVTAEVEPPFTVKTIDWMQQT